MLNQLPHWNSMTEMLGSVHSINVVIDLEVLRRLSHRKDGNPFPNNAF